MNSDLSVLFLLVRYALAGEDPPAGWQEAADEECLSRVCAIARAHSIDNLVAAALESLCPTAPITKKMQKYRLLYVYQITGLEYDLSQLKAVFAGEKIDCMPLKGSVLRDWYPESWMRTGCDIDMLVREQDLTRAIAALRDGCGYRESDRGFHDVSLYSASGGHVELHHSLIEEGELPRVAHILRSIWQYAVPDEKDPSCYLMNDEMFLFYHVAHMAKHVARGGCGIRPFLDLWILSQRMDFDAASVTALLEQGGLDTFFAVCRRLLAVWMQGAPHDDMTSRLASYIVHGGRYGAQDSALAARRGRGENKTRHFLRLMFLPRENLALIYPNLEKHPVLFPFYQVRRWFRVFHRDKRAKIERTVRTNRELDEKTIADVHDMLLKLGLE